MYSVAMFMNFVLSERRAASTVLAATFQWNVGWHRRSRPARSKSHVNLAACRHRRTCGRPEGVARDQEHGRRKHRSLALGPRRPDQAWPATTAAPHRRRRARIGEGACRCLGGCTATTMFRAQAQVPARPRAPERLHDEVTADYTDMIMRLRPRKSRPAAKPSSASGGYATAP